jgi:hypothetical protein
LHCEFCLYGISAEIGRRQELIIELTSIVIAGFMAPEEIGTTKQSLLLLLPLVFSIAFAYKATKVSRISFGNFIKESVVLFLSIMAFLLFIALILAAIAHFVTR